MWDNTIFDRAFDRAGIRQRVVRVVDGVAGEPFMARFDRPQQIVLDGVVHTTEYTIEYTTADVSPPLDYDDVLDIEVAPGKTERYRVRQEPLIQGDGHWTRAELEAT